ncbi:MAG: RluA family pseudouridine synthase [Planctomycetes bacterium]|nr:RluA family pseudouridine synthase [Planctomycetota bacterium]
MTERFAAAAAQPLLAFLAERLPGWKKNTLRERLESGCVRVNGEVIVRANHALAPGDVVELAARASAPTTPVAPRGATLLHGDEELVAIDKPAGLLSVSTERERERTALAMLRHSLSRPGREATLWPVHRLDRETSGVLLFARTRVALETVQARWDEVRKTYFAVVEGRLRDPEGRIEKPLVEDGEFRVRVGEGPGSKPAATRYRVRESGASRSLLEVELETGRKHQIRVHLAAIGHPVVGDARYGQEGPRLGLHAWRLELRHPKDGRRLVLEAPMPGALTALLRAGSRTD